MKKIPLLLGIVFSLSVPSIVAAEESLNKETEVNVEIEPGELIFEMDTTSLNASGELIPNEQTGMIEINGINGENTASINITDRRGVYSSDENPMLYFSYSSFTNNDPQAPYGKPLDGSEVIMMDLDITDKENNENGASLYWGQDYSISANLFSDPVQTFELTLNKIALRPDVFIPTGTFSGTLHTDLMLVPTP